MPKRSSGRTRPTLVSPWGSLQALVLLSKMNLSVGSITCGTEPEPIDSHHETPR
jgi:hypothetical protein